MKHSRFALAASFAISLAMLSACGEKVTEVTQVTTVQQVSMSTALSEKDLPDCDENNNGLFVITEDKKNVFVCYAKEWYVLNGQDGSATKAKDGTNGKDGKNGSNGKDGSSGEDGASCSGKPFESGDSTGYMIVCGEDTLGVVLNGKDGADGSDGKNGIHGVEPGLANKLAKRMKRGINSMVFYSPGKDFKGFNDEEMVSDWGYDNSSIRNKLRKSDFKMIADKGFDHIRLVVQWDVHFVGDSSKCNIDPEYMKQVRWAVENTNAAGMIAVVDEHNLIFEMKPGIDFKGNGYTYAQVTPCEKAIYRQIIEEMKDISPDSFVVELPNEPTVDAFITAEQWNNLVDSLIQIIHGVDPARVIIVGSRNYYSRDFLEELRLDNSDGLLIASFHYYEPYSFTQNCGANTALKFENGKNVWDDTCGTETWKGTKSQMMTIFNDFEVAARWSSAHGNIPIYLGEFGVREYVKDTASSEKWLGAVAQIADYFGFATAVFSFDSDTHLYHIGKDKWDTYKLRALFNPKNKFSAPARADLDTVSKTVLLEDFEGDFPVSKLSSELGYTEAWDFYSNCKDETDCDVVVTTNESGTKVELTTLASFTTKKGHTGDGLYMKLVADAPEGVDPYYMLQVNFVPYAEGSPTYIDFSGLKAISFYAKGQGRIRVALLTAYSDSIATANNTKWNAGFYAEYALSNEWTRYVLWPDELIPEKYSVLEAKGGEWDKANDRVYKIVAKQGNNVVAGEKSTVEWYLDDFTIYGLDLLDFQ